MVSVSTETITIRMSPEEVPGWPSMSRSAFVRELLRRAGPLDEAHTYARALLMLATSALGGPATTHG